MNFVSPLINLACTLVAVDCDSSSGRSSRSRDESVVLAVCMTIGCIAMCHFVVHCTVPVNVPSAPTQQPRQSTVAFLTFFIVNVVGVYAAFELMLSGLLAAYAILIGSTAFATVAFLTLVERRRDWIASSLPRLTLISWTVVIFCFVALPHLLTPLTIGNDPILPMFRGQAVVPATDHSTYNVSHVWVYFDDVHIQGPVTMEVTNGVVSSAARTSITSATIVVRETATLMLIGTTPLLYNTTIICSSTPCVVLSESAAISGTFDHSFVVLPSGRREILTGSSAKSEAVQVRPTHEAPSEFVRHQPFPQTMIRRMPLLFQRLQRTLDAAWKLLIVIAQHLAIWGSEFAVVAQPAVVSIAEFSQTIILAASCSTNVSLLVERCAAYDVYYFDDSLYMGTRNITSAAHLVLVDILDCLPVADSLRVASQMEWDWAIATWGWIRDAVLSTGWVWEVTLPLLWDASTVVWLTFIDCLGWSFQFSFVGDETAVACSLWMFHQLFDALGPSFWLLASFLSHYGRRLLSLYSDTSLVTHVAVVLLQSALLVVVLWREFRSKVQERRNATEWWRRVASVPSVLAESLGAYGKPLAAYTAAHLVAVILVIGTSVIPFASLLHLLVLQLLLPVISVRSWTLFFDGNDAWTGSLLNWHVCRLLFFRICLCTLLQKTVGDALYYVVMEILFGLSAALCSGLAIYFFTRRRFAFGAAASPETSE